MTTKFLDAGTDATSGFEFYSSITGSVSSVGTPVRTGPAAIAANSGAGNATGYAERTNVLTGSSDAGNGRISVAINVPALPGANAAIITPLGLLGAVPQVMFHVRLLTDGKLRVVNSAGTTLGTGAWTLATGTWYRITVAWKITSTTVNEIRVFVNNDTTPDISVTNATLGSFATPDMIRLGWTEAPGASKTINLDDVYVDDSDALTNPGNIRVTAKLPAALNTNNFDTAIGSSTNRWESVNERALSEAKGWQHAAATDVQENYGLQAAATGDADVSNASLIARTAWLWGKRGALTPCTHRASAASSSTNPTTSMSITIPASTATGDSLFVQVTSRGHTSSDAYPTVTDDDSGGNTWTRIAESSDRKATLWWKRATSGTASKTITVGGCITSCAGGVAVYQNASTTATPYTDIVVESNASANETHAGFTPSYAGSAICFGVFNYNDDNVCGSQTTGNLGALTERWDMLSNPTGTVNDCANMHCSLDQTDTPPASTGSITWAQANDATYSISWAVRPEIGAPKLMDNGTESDFATELKSTSALFTKITDSASYPSNGAGIGMRSTGMAVDVILYECGTMIAYTLVFLADGAATGVGATSGVGAAVSAGVGSATGVAAVSGDGEATQSGATAESAGAAETTGACAALWNGVGAVVALATAAAVAVAFTLGAGSADGVASTQADGVAVSASAATATGEATSLAQAVTVLPGVGAADGVAATDGVSGATAGSAGAATGLADATGTSGALAASVAAGDGVATAAATGAVTATATADAAAVADATAQGFAVVSGAGNAVGEATTAAVATGLTTATAAATGVASADAVSGATAGVLGAAVGAADTVGLSLALTAAVGSSDGVAAAAAVAAQTVEASATSTATADALGVGGALWLTTGAAGGEAVTGAAGASLVEGVGTVAGAADAQAVAVSFGQGVGAALGVATTSGAGTGIWLAIGVAAGDATASADGTDAGAAGGDGFAAGDAAATAVGALTAAAMAAAAGEAATVAQAVLVLPGVGLAAGEATAAASSIAGGMPTLVGARFSLAGPRGLAG